jgi:hypothetical protein
MNQVTLVDGKLFGAVNTTVASQGQPDRVGIAFFVVGAESDNNGVRADISDQGYVAVDGQNVLFPSIGVDVHGSGAMAFTLTGPDFFPSAAFVRFDESGAHGPMRITGAGVFPDDGFTGYQTFGGDGVARWVTTRPPPPLLTAPSGLGPSTYPARRAPFSPTGAHSSVAYRPDLTTAVC